MATIALSLENGGRTKKVHVKTGTALEDIASQFERVFPQAGGGVVGLRRADDGTVFPLSLFARIPSAFDGMTFTLLQQHPLPQFDLDDNDDESGGEVFAEEIPGMPNLSTDDIIDFIGALRKTQFDVNDISQLFDIFFDASNEDGQLTKMDFESCVGKLIRQNSMSAHELEFFQLVLTCMFSAFDRTGTDTVDCVELLAAFAMLMHAKTESKLSVGLHLFAMEIQDQPVLMEDAAARAFCSMLTMLFSISMDSEDSHALQDIAQELALYTARIAFHIASMTDDNERTAFVSVPLLVEICQTKTMRSRVPWLSMLDIFNLDNSEQGAYRSPVVACETVHNQKALQKTETAPAFGFEDEEPVFDFELTNSGDHLTILPSDVDGLDFLVHTTQLVATPPTKVYDALSDEDGLNFDPLNKDEFDAVVRSLVPGKLLSDHEKQYLSYAFANVFWSFDRDDTGFVDGAELAIGLSLFCSGSKSDKLSKAFEKLAVSLGSPDGRLDKRGVKRFLRGFLTSLFAINDKAADEERTFVYAVVENCVADATNSIMRYALTNGAVDEFVSFDQFGMWYNNGGHDLIPWLELLDLSKWPFPSQNDGVGAAEEEKEEDSSSASEKNEEDEEGEAVFNFQLTDDGKSFSLYPWDVENLHLIASVSGLAERLPSEVIEGVLAAQSKPATFLSKSDFDSAMRDLIPGGSLAEEEKAFLTFALSNVYYAFDYKQLGVVDMKEFVSGFSMLSKGNKSDKLALAFQLFDDSNTGFLSQNELAKYLRAFLAMMIALCEHYLDLESEARNKFINESIEGLVTKIFIETAKSREHDGFISFEEFATWYSNGGFSVMPWLELLDLKKWPVTEGSDLDETIDFEEAPQVIGLKRHISQGKIADSISQNSKRKKVAEVAASQSIEESYSEPIFEFVLLTKNEAREGNLSSNEVTLTFDDGDIDGLQLTLSISKLNEIDAEHLVELVNNACGFVTAQSNQPARLSKADFDSIIRSLVDGKQLHDTEKEYLSFALSNLFYMFDRQDSAEVLADEFVAGLMLCFNGSKSDKLALAFDLFDEDGDGMLTETQLYRYIRAFLTFLMALSERSVMADGTLLERIIDVTSTGIAYTIMHDQTDGSLISFEEFADWYTNGGYKVVPWLELLDNNKWPKLDTSDLLDDNATSAANMAEDKRDRGEEIEQEEQPVFEFPLANMNDQLHSLTILPSDVENLHLLLSASGFSALDVSDIVEAFSSNARIGVGNNEDLWIDKGGFDAGVRALIPGQSLNQAEKEYLSFTLSNLFIAFTHPDDSHDLSMSAAGYAPFEEVCAGFFLLCSGNKSDKLAKAFELFRPDNQGRLDRAQLYRYLRSFLTMIANLTDFALAGDASEADELDMLVTGGATVLTDFIFEQAATTTGMVGETAKMLFFPRLCIMVHRRWL
jgi:Ca2+-binding EF-hand superfamily protein